MEIINELKGKVLEVGVGTGKNIPYYPNDINVTSIDISDKMLAQAKKKAIKLNKDIVFMQMDVQDLKFPEQTFDTIFCTCVFCSVPDPIKGLKEIKRVCKSGGKIVMMEHVRSERKLLGLLMDVFNKSVNLFGCNMNRRTVSNIKKLGFKNIKVNNLAGEILKKIVIYKDNI